jgi:hypothetical protein
MNMPKSQSYNSFKICGTVGIVVHGMMHKEV